MKKLMLVIFGLFVIGIESAAAEESQVILSFGTMIGNSGPFIGSRNPIRGIPAGGASWVVLGGAVGQLSSDGVLYIDVSGLVLASTLMNPSAAFRGLVSCLSVDDKGEVANVNVSTDNFPADTDGNSTILAAIKLPVPCFAPIIFVTSPAGSWFATTGL